MPGPGDRGADRVSDDDLVTDVVALTSSPP